MKLMGLKGSTSAITKKGIIVQTLSAAQYY